MSQSNKSPGKAVALRYGDGDTAPVIVASGMGYLAEKIVEVAADNGVPIYEDNSLATLLAQLELGREIPEALYQAIVEIYVYFLNFNPTDPEGRKRAAAEETARAAEAAAEPPPEGGDADAQQ